MLAIATRSDCAAMQTTARVDPVPVLDLANHRRLQRRLDPERAWIEASDAERGRARERERFVRDCEALIRRGTSRAAAVAAVSSRPDLFPLLLGRGTDLSVYNFDGWRKRYHDGGGRPQALLEAYRAGAARRELAVDWFPAFREVFTKLFFHANGLDVSAAYRNAVVKLRDMGHPESDIPSQTSAEHYIRKTVGERVACLMRDPARYRDELAGYFMLDWNCEPGAVWVGDHRVLDIFVRHPIYDDAGNIVEWIPLRPWCTAWMDAKSGFMVSCIVYCDRYPNHAKIMESLWRGIRANGNVPPMVLITDNGKDYLKHGALRDVALQVQDEPTRGRNGRNTLVEEAFTDLVVQDGDEYRHSIARSLGVAVRTTSPYSGRQKPIERTFRNMARAFDKLYYGYCGNKPGRRPEEMSDFRGNVMRLITEGELTDFLGPWLENHYHRASTASRRTAGRTPRDLWDSRRPCRPPITDEELAWAMLLPHRNTLDVRGGPGGSNIWFNGWPYEGVSADDHVALGDYHGKALMVKTSWAPILPDVRHDGKDLPARIYLFTLDGRPLCQAQPAMERTVFGTTAEQDARISETCRKVAILRRADRAGRDALTGGGPVFSPAHTLGMQQQVGGAISAPLPGIAQGTAKGRLRGRLAAAATAAPDHAPTAPPPGIAPAPEYREFLRREAADRIVDLPAADPDAFARFQATTRAEETAS